jgi:hypothetical protein
MITLSKGLSISLQILEQLRNDEDLINYTVTVKTLTNARECGLVFIVNGCIKDGKYECFKPFTFCTYEHRNSDNIIINGLEGYHDNNGSLPYKGKSKYEYIAEFSYNQVYEAAEALTKLIREYADTMYANVQAENKKLIKELESGTIEFDPTNPLKK